MALPAVTLPDPKMEAEGGIDPLGVALIADRLADDMLPGMTQRMARPRFVSLMCTSSVITEALDVRAEDGTPPHIAYEWLVVQSFAQLHDEVRRVPGMLKAKAALRDNVPLSPRRYLKSPTIFGFHGVYKTLGVALGVLDEDLRLRPAGERLLLTWEKATGLDGFLSGDKASPGGRLRTRLRELVLEALDQGFSAPPPNAVRDALQTTCRPDQIQAAESAVLRDLLDDARGGTRGEVFRLLVRSDVQKAFTGSYERPFLRFLEPIASPELRSTLAAIEAFERVIRPIQDGFDWIRFLSTKNRLEPLSADSFAELAPPGLVKELPRALADVLPAVVGRKAAPELDVLVRDFEGVRTLQDLFTATLRRHEQAQRRKPPAGKRPWFERSPEGRALVRPLYRLEEAPSDIERGVYFYRTAAVASFLSDLGGMA
jgi:hypothetical protein